MRKIKLNKIKGIIINMDEKSTPIESLNNRSDDSEVVNKILSKYNNLQDGSTTIETPNNIAEMENNYENRNLNKEIYDLNSNNIQYKEHYQNDLNRRSQYQKLDDVNENENDYEEYEEEYEVIETPLWKRILNEIRIPLFIFLVILILFNCTFDKLLLSKIPKLGNQFNECNTYGFLLKVFVVSLLSYILIKFIRF
jgi:hypothetical protein